MEIRSVPSSGRPGAQLGHHILVRHWLIFTFDSDRNGTWKDGGHKYLLAKKLEGIEIKEGRPDLKTFQAGMSKIKGCAGLDGWNKEEMKVIGKCQGAVRLIWQTMAMWESYNCIPSAVNHCKLVHLAKICLEVNSGRWQFCQYGGEHGLLLGLVAIWFDNGLNIRFRQKLQEDFLEHMAQN